MSDSWQLAERLELFFGRTSDAVAYVYARLPGVAADGAYQLAGTLRGPSCAYAETLPATSQLIDQGPGASLLAAATVPEPCYWTPEMPHLYQADVEVRSGARVHAAVRRTFAFRNLGAAGGKLLYDGKRWVLRAVARHAAPSCELAVWRNASAAMLVRSAPEQLCQDASRIGVLLVVEVDTIDDAQLRRFGQWPAVGALLASQADPTGFSGKVGHNLLLAQRFDAEAPVMPDPWAQAAIVEVGSPESFAERASGSRVAVMPARRVGAYPSVERGRAACDQLQRDLASLGDWAGYVAE